MRSTTRKFLTFVIYSESQACSGVFTKGRASGDGDVGAVVFVGRRPGTRRSRRVPFARRDSPYASVCECDRTAFLIKPFGFGSEQVARGQHGVTLSYFTGA